MKRAISYEVPDTVEWSKTGGARSIAAVEFLLPLLCGYSAKQPLPGMLSEALDRLESVIDVGQVQSDFEQLGKFIETLLPVFESRMKMLTANAKAVTAKMTPGMWRILDRLTEPTPLRSTARTLGELLAEEPLIEFLLAVKVLTRTEQSYAVTALGYDILIAREMAP